jgi:hypothetical protein
VAESTTDNEGSTMRGNPFLRFHRTAEAAGYPALLIVSGVCLAIVVSGVGLLALTPGTFGLAVAVLNLAAAVAILSGAILAATDDVEAPTAEGKAAGSRSAQPAPVVPLSGGRPPDVKSRTGRRAA